MSRLFFVFAVKLTYGWYIKAIYNGIMESLRLGRVSKIIESKHILECFIYTSFQYFQGYSGFLSNCINLLPLSKDFHGEEQARVLKDAYYKRAIQ